MVLLSFWDPPWAAAEAQAAVGAEVCVDVFWDQTSDLREEVPAVCFWDQHRPTAPDAPCDARVS